MGHALMERAILFVVCSIILGLVGLACQSYEDLQGPVSLRIDNRSEYVLRVTIDGWEQEVPERKVNSYTILARGPSDERQITFRSPSGEISGTLRVTMRDLRARNWTVVIPVVSPTPVP